MLLCDLCSHYRLVLMSFCRFSFSVRVNGDGNCFGKRLAERGIDELTKHLSPIMRSFMSYNATKLCICSGSLGGIFR